MTKTSFKVSWVRHRDIHLLTVGKFTYTSDQRFQCIHDQQTGEWSLKVSIFILHPLDSNIIIINSIKPFFALSFATHNQKIQVNDKKKLFAIKVYLYILRTFKKMLSTCFFLIGVYECQISTTPPVGRFVYLSVVGEFHNAYI